MNNFTLDSILEEIKKNLGSKRMKEIEEEQEDPPSSSQSADTTASAADRQAFRNRTGSTVGGPAIGANQPSDTVATSADRDAFRARTGSTVNSTTGQTQSSQPSDTVASAADRQAFRARTGSTVGASTPPAARPAGAAPAARPAGAPVTSVRPAGTPVRPAQAAAPAQTRSSQAFQSYSDKGDNASSADFFRADRQAQAERRSAPAAVARPTAGARPASVARPTAGVRPPARPPVGTGGGAGNVRVMGENFDQFVKGFLKESKNDRR